ncbi:MAG: SOS response-associated peptidase [Chloroflexi bacterium]|nr:SOS response-associated peptidase [Chloroflexota bacterium]MYD47673.1 SOS response-associated peptidase [Chloroflexota bacterium]
MFTVTISVSCPAGLTNLKTNLRDRQSNADRHCGQITETAAPVGSACCPGLTGPFRRLQLGDLAPIPVRSLPAPHRLLAVVGHHPNRLVLALTAKAGQRQASIMHWGFTFSRARSSAGSWPPLFNARSETIAEQPAFRSAFASRRCLVPINGITTCT